MQPNPPWVTRSLRQAWDALERLVGPERMPVMTARDTRDRAAPEEFGSGHYGTVMPTHTDGIVIKVTSDPTEAAFVASALSIGEFPEGIVRYERIVALPEKLRGRGVFVLWREEAESGVGVQLGNRAAILEPEAAAEIGIRAPNDLRYLRRDAMRLIYEFKAAASLLRAQKDYAPVGDDEKARDVGLEVADEVFRRGVNEDEYLRTAMSRRAPRGAFRTQVLYEILDWCFDMMENTEGIDLVGGALRFYFDRGILLADVHANNIGRVHRDDHGGLVNAITDPGHAVFLDDRYDGVVIPPLDVAVAANKRRT